MKKYYKTIYYILVFTLLNSVLIKDSFPQNSKKATASFLSPKTSFRNGRFNIESSISIPLSTKLLIAGIIGLCIFSCSKDPLTPENPPEQNDTTTVTDTNQIKDIHYLHSYITELITGHLENKTNQMGLPYSRVTTQGYTWEPTHPERAYVYDIGRLFIYCSTNKKLWKNLIQPSLNSMVNLQNPTTYLWPLSFDDQGPAEADAFLGPSVVNARGLLMWAEHSQETDAYEDAAMNLADYLMNNPNHKIATPSNNYLYKQDLTNATSSASMEENARVAALFLELYNYLLEENSLNLANTYLNEAEKILKAAIELKGNGTIFPFGAENNGTPVFEMYGLEGIDAQIIMMKAFQQYADQVPLEKQDQQIAFEYSNGLFPIMEWVRNTFQLQNEEIILPDGSVVSVPLTYPKRIGKKEIWPEIMADIMILEQLTFNNEQEFNAGLTSLIKMMEFNPFLPTLLALPSGYSQEPVWDYGQEMNKPYGSLINLIVMLEAIETISPDQESTFLDEINNFFSTAA